jgi:hypothetical protein
MPKMKMSESCKSSMTEQFGFKNSELIQIENFMNEQNKKTAKDILESLMSDNKLDDRQKIIIAYVVGNSARNAAIQEDLQGIKIEQGGVPPIGG